jgi:hypothetical protein
VLFVAIRGERREAAQQVLGIAEDEAGGAAQLHHPRKSAPMGQCVAGAPDPSA